MRAGDGMERFSLTISNRAAVGAQGQSGRLVPAGNKVYVGEVSLPDAEGTAQQQLHLRVDPIHPAKQYRPLLVRGTAVGSHPVQPAIRQTVGQVEVGSQSHSGE